LLSGFLSDPISRPLFRSSAVGCAMSIECGHTIWSGLCDEGCCPTLDSLF